MIKAYFISDLHIGAEKNHEEARKQSIILKFLDKIAKDATHLYIVGDLFDFWFEYKHVIPKHYFPFLIRFSQMVNNGTKIYYLAGNHDFYLGEFFDRTLGIQTFNDEYTFTLASKRFYLFHGDGVAKKDVGYRILKKMLRNRFNQKLFRLLHPDWGIPFARLVSGSSRLYTDTINLRDESDYINFAGKKFKQGFDYVIMGHRHNPLVHKNDRHIYINLGDWIRRFSYAEFDGKQIVLKYFREGKE